MYNTIIKRVLDLLISIVSIIVLSPIFLIIMMAIKLESKGPVFFSQSRVGKDGIKFKVHKFRSMLTFEESFYSDGTPIENYDRITKVGNLLRKSSLDELPQIFNILKGEMSLVGPRPTLEYQVEKYNEFQKKRLLVRPGLTGWAQVNGRNSLSWEEKIKFDVEYVEYLSLKLDLTIIFKTFGVLFKANDNSFTKPDELSKHDGKVEDDVNK